MSTELLGATLREIKHSSVAPGAETIQKLDSIAKRLQSDPDFRTELGAIEASVWSELASVLQDAQQKGPEPENVEMVMFLFRIVRNIAAGNSVGQDRARHANIPEIIQSLLSQAACIHYGNVTYIQMLRAGIQALSNLVTGNETSKDHVWKSFMKQTDPSLNLLCTLAAIEDEAIVFGTVMFSFNCIFESRKRSTLLLSTSTGNALLRQLAIVSQETSNKENRLSFEMIYKLFDHLINFDFSREIFYALRQLPEDSIDTENERPVSELTPMQPQADIDMTSGSRSEGAGTTESTHQNSKSVAEHPLSSEQVTFLKMLDSRIYVWHEKQQRLWSQSNHVEESSEDTPATGNFSEPTVSLETVAFLTDIFRSLSELTIDVFKTLILPGVGKRSVEDLSNLSASVLLLLGCFSHLSQVEDGISGPPNDNEATSVNNSLPNEQNSTQSNGKSATIAPAWFIAQHKAMVEHGLIESAIELLRQADISLARIVEPVSTGASSSAAEGAHDSSLLTDTSTEQGQQMFFRGLKRDIVRVVGNMSFRSRDVQDRIRGCNGLVVMLNQCNIDDSNPYLREYAIMALKSILADNVENQAIIRELEPIDTVDHPVLREARVSAQLDMNTGKPVLKKV